MSVQGEVKTFYRRTYCQVTQATPKPRTRIQFEELVKSCSLHPYTIILHIEGLDKRSRSNEAITNTHLRIIFYNLLYSFHTIIPIPLLTHRNPRQDIISLDWIGLDWYKTSSHQILQHWILSNNFYQEEMFHGSKNSSQ